MFKYLIAFCLSINFTYAQNVCKCKDISFYTSCENPPKISDSSKLYFNTLLAKFVGKRKGTAVIDIMIDTMGRACCKQITAFKPLDIHGIAFEEIINGMPYWTPATQNHHKVIFRTTLFVFFDKNSVKVAPGDDKR